MYVKFASNEVTLRSEGTVAGDAPPVVELLEPHAATNRAETLAHAASARRRYRANLIWTSCPLAWRIPAVFFPLNGARVRRQQAYSEPMRKRLIRERAASIAHV
jgi:hypothetical protein